MTEKERYLWGAFSGDQTYCYVAEDDVQGWLVCICDRQNRILQSWPSVEAARAGNPRIDSILASRVAPSTSPIAS